MARQHKDSRYFFYKKIFYLDLKNFRSEMDLIKDIKRFGGKIESFLSKDVNYVISDKPEAKPKIEPSYPETPSSLAPLRSPSELYKSPYGFLPSPAPSSPFNERGKGTVIVSNFRMKLSGTPTSRGLALVQKAKQKSEGSGDVLGICNQWKIKVFHVQVIKFFINKLKNLYGKREQEKKESCVLAEQVQSPHLKLTVPFVKLEDVKMRYRAHYKELKPTDPVFKSDLSWAFRKVCEDFHYGGMAPENPESSVLKEISSPRRDQLSPITVNFTPVIRKNFSTSSVFKKQFGSKMGLLNDSKEHCINESKENLRNESKENVMKLHSIKRMKDNKGSSNSTRRDRKLAKQKYCEMCQEQYVDLETHISSNMHKNYVNDTIYFGDLHEVISAMPGLDSFMKKVARQRQERMLQQAEFGTPKTHNEHQFEVHENHCARIPVLNCEENFSDSTKGVQPEDERTENGNVIPGPFAVGNDHALENQDPPISLVNPHIKPASPAHCDNVCNNIYNDMTEEYVSASCSTDDSNMLPYLEDSADNLVSCKESPGIQHVSPALLRKESPVIETNCPLPLIAFGSPYPDAEDAWDLSCRTINQNNDNVTLCSFQMETAVKNGSAQNGDPSSTAALDLSLPPRQLSPVFSYVSRKKRMCSAFSMNKPKRLKFDTVACSTDALPMECADSSFQNDSNSSVTCPAPNVKNDVAEAGAELPSINAKCDNGNNQNICQDSLNCALLLLPIGSEMRVLNEEATKVEEHCSYDELDLCLRSNAAVDMKDCNDNLELNSCAESQQCVKAFSPLPSAMYMTGPPLYETQEHKNSSFKVESVTPISPKKSPSKDLTVAVDSCGAVVGLAEVGICNAGPAVNVVNDDESQMSHHDSTSGSLSGIKLIENPRIKEKANDANPILECYSPDKNDQLPCITSGVPILEPNVVGTLHSSSVLAPLLNTVCNASSVIQSGIEANLQSLEVTPKQNSHLGLQNVSVNVDSMCSSPDKAVTVECAREINLTCPGISLNECGPICVENVNDEHQDEPAFLSFKENNAQTNSASVSLCTSKLPDSQADGNACNYNNNQHEKKTISLSCEHPQLSATDLPCCCSESLDSQKDCFDCKYYDCSKAMPFDLETDIKVSGLPAQIGTLHNSALNFSGNHSSGGIESVVASDGADASKWVSECDISSESDPDWGNVKSNVDSLCQELEKLNSEPEVTEFPLNLALI